MLNPGGGARDDAAEPWRPRVPPRRFVTTQRAACLALERARAERFAEGLVNELERGWGPAARAARLGADRNDRDDLAASALLVLGVRNEREREPVVAARVKSADAIAQRSDQLVGVGCAGILLKLRDCLAQTSALPLQSGYEWR